jgi:hypothetical protein
MWIDEFKLALAGVLGLVVLIGLLPFTRICKRSGLSRFWAVLVAIPIVNIIFVYYVAAIARRSLSDADA